MFIRDLIPRRHDNRKHKYAERRRVPPLLNQAKADAALAPLTQVVQGAKGITEAARRSAESSRLNPNLGDTEFGEPKNLRTKEIAMGPGGEGNNATS